MVTKLKLAFVSTLLALIFFSEEACNKSNNNYVGTPAAFNVVNAIPTATRGIQTIFGQIDSPYYYSKLSSLSYGSSYLYSPVSGKNSFYVVQRYDTTFTDLKAPLFNGSLTLQSAAVYTLFLAGDTTSVDTLLTEDNIPYNPIGDSISSVRFVNMCTGSQPFNVTIRGNPASQTEFSNIYYKGVTEWKNYPAVKSVGGHYYFTLRDQATGDSLTSFTWTYQVYKSNTIVIAGSEVTGSTHPFKLFSTNYY